MRTGPRFNIAPTPRSVRGEQAVVVVVGDDEATDEGSGVSASENSFPVCIPLCIVGAIWVLFFDIGD